MTPLLPHTTLANKDIHAPAVMDVDSKLEQAKYGAKDPQQHKPLFTQRTPEMEEPVGPELGRLWAPPHTFSRFFEEQYVPYLQLASSYSLASKQRFVLRYEDIERDPTGTFFKLLATTVRTESQSRFIRVGLFVVACRDSPWRLFRPIVLAGTVRLRQSRLRVLPRRGWRRSSASVGGFSPRF